MKLIATKSLRYNTRRLVAGDEFEASDKDGKLLIGIRKAVVSTNRSLGRIDAPPAGLTKRIAPSTLPLSDQTNEAELDQLRAAAIAAGVTVDKRWGARRLQAEIEQAKASKGDAV